MGYFKNLFKCVVAQKENDTQPNEIEKDIQKIWRAIDKSNEAGKEKITEVKGLIDLAEKNIFRKLDEVKQKENSITNQIAYIEKEIDRINRTLVRLENELSVKTLNQHTLRCI